MMQQQVTMATNSGAPNSMVMSNQGGINNYSVVSNAASVNSSMPFPRPVQDIAQVPNLDLTQLFANG